MNTTTPAAENTDKPRHFRAERCLREHFGFDCGHAYDLGGGLLQVGKSLYGCYRSADLTTGELLNSIDLGEGFCLLAEKGAAQ